MFTVKHVSNNGKSIKLFAAQSIEIIHSDNRFEDGIYINPQARIVNEEGKSFPCAEHVILFTTHEDRQKGDSDLVFIMNDNGSTIDKITL